MIEALEDVEPGEAPLVVGEASGRLSAALAHPGTEPRRWLRRAGGDVTAAAWPPAGPFSAAFIRLPKAKDELRFLLDAASAAIPPTAPLVVFGANDEGIKSAAHVLEAFAEPVKTLATRRHCRVIAGERRREIPGLIGHLAGWRGEIAIDLGRGARRWATYPGLFARGQMDDGTRLLLASLPPIPPGARILDFAGGTGVIAAALGDRVADARIELIDADALAVLAARENVPNVQVFLGADLQCVATKRYTMIISNPPVHQGVAEDRTVLDHLIATAPSLILAGGLLQIVVQRRIKAVAQLEAAFGNAEVVADDGRFTVLRARAQARRRG